MHAGRYFFFSVLSGWMWLWAVWSGGWQPCTQQGSWNYMIIVILFNPGHSMILLLIFAILVFKISDCLDSPLDICRDGTFLRSGVVVLPWITAVHWRYFLVIIRDLLRPLPAPTEIWLSKRHHCESHITQVASPLVLGPLPSPFFSFYRYVRWAELAELLGDIKVSQWCQPLLLLLSHILAMTHL